ncbi:hypothetical protein OH77DRAFT_1514104 [Trametes cingulata]|nr:hypothetical protein OH77DRAFT_1514104 [Trametes cingulata]
MSLTPYPLPFNAYGGLHMTSFPASSYPFGGRIPVAKLQINQLPAEVLALILIFVADVPAPQDYWTVHRTVAIWPKTWYRILAVCKYWFSVALDTTELWRIIQVQRSPAWLQLSLARSRDLPVYIFFHTSDAVEPAIPVLRAHAHRIRTLQFIALSPNGAAPLAKALFHRMSFPILEDVGFDQYLDERTPVKSMPLSNRALPSLRILRLSETLLPWTTAGFSSLRVLEISEITWLPADLEPSLSDFMRFLQRFPRLERLALKDMTIFPDTFNAASSLGDPKCPVVALPHLRNLDIRFPSSVDPRWTHAILTHLRLPRTVRLQIDLLITEDPGPWYPPWDEIDFPYIFPQDTTSLPLLQEATSAWLTHYAMVRIGSTQEEGSLILRVYNTDKPDDGMSGHQGEDWGGIWIHEERPCLRGFCTTFANAPLTALHMRAPSCYDETEEEPYLVIMRAFPTLQTLSLDYMCDPWFGNVGPLNTALLTPATPGDATRGPSSLLLPNLRDLRIMHILWYEDIVPEILETLRARAQRGLFLSNLFLGIVHRKVTYEQGLSLHAADLQSLRQLVHGSVVYANPDPEEPDQEW